MCAYVLDFGYKIVYKRSISMEKTLIFIKVNDQF